MFCKAIKQQLVQEQQKVHEYQAQLNAINRAMATIEFDS